MKDWRKKMKRRSRFLLARDEDYIVEQKHKEQARKVMNDKNCDRKLERMFGKVRR